MEVVLKRTKKTPLKLTFTLRREDEMDPKNVLQMANMNYFIDNCCGLPPREGDEHDDDAPEDALLKQQLSFLRFQLPTSYRDTVILFKRLNHLKMVSLRLCAHD